MNKNFAEILKQQLIIESENYFTDNRDPYSINQLTNSKRVINFFKRFFFSKPILGLILSNNYLYRNILLGKLLGLNQYIDKLGQFYNLLDDEESKFLLVKLISFRVLGHVKVKLPLSKPSYWEGIHNLENIADSNDKILLNHFPFQLNKHDLDKYNLPFKVYCDSKAVYTTYFIKQYEYSVAGKHVGPEQGDVVIDLGACFGDTALLFAEQVGEKGKVYSFEFVPGNIDIIRKNIALNPSYENRIEIVKHPVWSESGKAIFFNDKGPSSVVRFEKFEGSEGETSTLSIDDLVQKYAIPHVDFIKSDIEGAEPFAIKGALETIRKFKPKLAISIYHSMNDFTGIVQQINDLNLGYKFYLGHCTIFASETVLFAKVD